MRTVFKYAYAPAVAADYVPGLLAFLDELNLVNRDVNVTVNAIVNGKCSTDITTMIVAKADLLMSEVNQELLNRAIAESDWCR